MVTACFSIGKIGEIEIFRVTQTAFIPLQFQQPNEDKTIEVILVFQRFQYIPRILITFFF